MMAGADSVWPAGFPVVTLASVVLSSPVNLNHPGRYLHWGVLQISVGNVVVIAVMLLLFVLALVLPFPKGRGRR